MKDKTLMWFKFLLEFVPTDEQHKKCMEFEEGYAEAWEALIQMAED